MDIQALTDALPTAPDVGHGAPDFYVYDEHTENKVRFANREDEYPGEVLKGEDDEHDADQEHGQPRTLTSTNCPQAPDREERYCL